MKANESNPTNTLDQIESEIREIDQMINSWSTNRTLRFDPAHVNPRKENKPSSAPASKPIKRSVGQIFFWFNLIAFSLPLGLLTLQSLANYFSPKMESFILIIALMVLAGGNLVLAAFESSRIKHLNDQKQPQAKTTRNANSLQSSS